MSGVASVLSTVATILGVWSAVSVLSVPLLVRCMRLQASLNARREGALRRESWIEAAGTAAR